MLSKGNTKLGSEIWSWSIPAVTTCPGRSQLCQKACYARRGHFVWSTVSQTYQQNLERSRRPGFSVWMQEEILRQNCTILRIHVSGDFYDAEYTQKWREIIQARRRTLFFTYTRSWRDPQILPVLKSLTLEKNCRMWFSCDRETGAPPRARRVRRAYMAVDDDDQAKFPVDLVFRTRHRTVMKRDRRGQLVCPYEQGVQRKIAMTCSRCRICFGLRGAKQCRRKLLST